jgi:hypothetical protein
MLEGAILGDVGLNSQKNLNLTNVYPNNNKKNNNKNNKNNKVKSKHFELRSRVKINFKHLKSYIFTCCFRGGGVSHIRGGGG